MQPDRFDEGDVLHAATTRVIEVLASSLEELQDYLAVLKKHIATERRTGDAFQRRA